ncbi:MULTISPECIES: glycosyltransferase family 2 protein [unclassified Caulobacter]|uniref:glycosyltransferase family 2 protein n=1 Tax=unclassified Caulobacter TaxID=2648921 RepID=UPI00064609BE|nr:MULTISPECIES: glycosyltransferase family 2 protein [unclassified Caulobacter]KQV62653.1 glycosyl transferase [Caulobacter sp. Root342]KQV71786.1 glycosyl transferase [Caulobacter sp. Root343]
MNSILPSASTLAVGARPAHPNVSVVMVVYRTGEALAQSIKHVLAEPLVDEFIIIDNGSSPQDEDMLRSLALTEPRVVLKQGHGNIGFARAANMGASTGGGEYIVFLNPDANLQPGCVAALVTAFRGQPTPTIVGARVLNVDGSEQRGGRRGEVTPISTVLSFGQLTRRYPKLAGFEIHRENEPVPRGPVPMPTISGACFAMRRCDFEALSGFDEGYFLHVEDIDLCWRARRAGGKVLFQPKAQVVHLGHTSLEHPVKVEFHKGVGLTRYFIKRADSLQLFAAAVLLAPAIMLMSVCRPLLWKLTGRPI